MVMKHWLDENSLSASAQALDRALAES